MEGERTAIYELITWLDSFGLPGGWEDVDDVGTQPITIQSAGMVLAEDERSITLAPHVGYLGGRVNQVGGALTIPKSAIVGRGRLFPGSEA